MNDLYYIEYNPELMLSDSMDMDAMTELAHRRLCDFIWRMDKPPKADNEFLKQFTKTSATDWGRVKKGLLEKGWSEVGGMLLHKGAIETLNAAKEKYAAQCNQTAPATAKKNGSDLKLMVCERDAVTGIVTIKVTTSVTSSVTLPVTTRQLEQELDKRERGESPVGEVIVPSWEEVKTWAQMDGVPEAVAREFFDHENSFGQWRAGGRVNGMPINARNAMKVWFNRGRKPNANNGKTNGASPDRNAGTYNQNRDNAGAKAKIRGAA